MTETTDYNELTVPTEHSVSDIDEDQWADILNTMFEDEADELLIKRGTLSDRPAAGNSKDSSRHRMYIAEDQDPPLLSIDSDSQGWIDVNSNIDADTVDGYEGSDLAALVENETVSGSWAFSSEQAIDGGLGGSLTGGVSLTDISGSNLSISSGALNATDTETTPEIRNAADFSGSDGGAQIQAAVNDLPSAGGVVWVPPVGPDTGGQWTVSSHILLDSDTRLVSNGALLYLADASDDNIIMTNEAEGDATTGDVVLEGLEMDGNRANNGQWTRPDGKTVNPACVYVLESTRITVRDCWFTSSVGYATKFAKTTDSTVRNCYATDMGDDAFTITDTRYSSATSAYNSVSNCTAENNSDAGFEVDDGPVHSMFDGCVSIGNAEGFDVHTHDFTDTPASPQNTYYSNCTAINNDWGWRLGANNHDDQAEGVYCQNINVSGSAIAAFSAGNSGSSSDEPPTEVYVDGFHFDHPASATQAAIDLRSPNGINRWSFSNGFIEGGRRAVNGDQGVDGLYLHNVNCNLSDMTDGESGIELNAGSTGHIRNVDIIGCSVTNAANSGIQLWTGGGQLARVRIIGGSYHNNGTGNTNSSGAAGISIHDNGGSPNEIAVLGVRCYDSSGTQETGIWWDGAVNSVFSSSIFRGNQTNSTDGTLGGGSVTSANVT